MSRQYGGYSTANAQRAGRTEDLMAIFRQWHQMPIDHDENVIDLLTNLRHYCDAYAVNFHQACDISYQHYLTEKREHS